MMKYKKSIIFIIVFICLAGDFIFVYIWKFRGTSFFAKREKWSVGIYTGSTPFNFISPENINNPVLTAKDVTDITADFVADPFMVRESSKWFMFFEVKNAHTNQGDIGMAMSDDGLNWKYKQIVLDEPFHLSYPYVFKWKSEYYMIPECHQTYSVRLYKAIDFPSKWSFVRTLIHGDYYTDPSVFRYDSKWWIFAGTNPKKNDVLRLYYADDLMGPWTEHPQSPIIKGNAHIARPGGRVLIFNNRIVRYTQDDAPVYGSQVRMFEITELSTQRYKEKEVNESPLLKKGWNAERMHHADPLQIDENKWIACVDGY